MRGLQRPMAAPEAPSFGAMFFDNSEQTRRTRVPNPLRLKPIHIKSSRSRLCREFFRKLLIPVKGGGGVSLSCQQSGSLSPKLTADSLETADPSLGLKPSVGMTARRMTALKDEG